MSRRSTTRFTALKYTYGEFLITRNSWKKNFEGKLQDNGNPFKSPRNTAAGILNREDPIEMTRNCEFIRYGADFESMRELCDSFFEFSSNILESESVRVTVSELMVNGHDWLMKLFNSYNESVPADGIVLYVDNLDRWKELGRKENGNPNYAIAYKHPDMTESYRTTVQRIEWQISKAGYMKPVVIVDDVDNGDCIMNSPTGYNARYIKENKIGYGAEVLLTRSGGVIPKIISVVEQANEFDCSLPTICPHCGEPLCFNESGVELMCVNKSCPGIRLAKCVFFYDTMKAENVGPALIKAMFDAGIDSVDRMVHVLPEDLYKIEGFGDGIANYILEANKKIMSGVELPVLMHASDCFEGLGQVKLRAMLDKYPQVEDMFMHGGWVEAGPEEGMSKTEAAFMVGLNSFSDFFYETCIPLKAPEAIVIAGDKCNGWSVCFSGVRDADLERLIESNGGKIASGVSKNTTHLVVKDTETTSSKIEKAKKLGVRIISIEDFKQSL